MNERIKEIIIETLGKEGVVDSRAFGHWAMSDEQMEKFAELIIHDIVKQCAEFAEYQLQIGGTNADKIKQHFGVEL